MMMNAKKSRHALSKGRQHQAVALDWRATTPCRFFQTGSCTKGSLCPFSHSLLNRSTVASQERDATTNPPAENRGSTKPPCKFFKAGSCIYGEKCLFRHDDGEVMAQNGVDNTFEDEPKQDDFKRTIGGALVQFEAGGRVSKIRLPSDFSAVCISGLPLNTSEESVRKKLAQKGLHVSADDVHMWQTGGSCGASVRSDDVWFAKRVFSNFRPGYRWKGAEIFVTAITAPMPSGHDARRVECKKVHVSWHKAVRNAWLNYASENVAQKVSDMFSKGAYQILNQKITAGQATKTRPAFHPWSPSHNSVSWTVMLANIPATAEKKDIMGAIMQERYRPRHIEVGLPSYTMEPEQAMAAIRTLILTEIGPLEYFELTLETKVARRVKATARFLHEADAQRAAQVLDKIELPFHAKARLTVKMVYSAKFKASTNVYDAVCPRILPQQRIWKSNNIAFRAYNSTDPLRRFRLLKLEGESADDIAVAKTDLESILSGVVAKVNGFVLWDPSLKANGNLFQEIKKLGKECSVVILRHKDKSELRLFGAENSCEEAQLRLAAKIRVASLSTSTRAIELEPHKFLWACRGGFKEIAARLGPQKASFDIISTPKKIVISGRPKDFDDALAIVEGKEQAPEPVEQVEPVEAVPECAVCWTEAEAPVKTQCGHVYCQECFERTCIVGDTSWTAGLTDDKDFVILCHGDRGECRSVIGVEDLQQHLPSSTLEDVLERSFSYRVKRNPYEFRYCASPDCGYIYRTTPEPRTHNCPNCLKPTCSACHESHVGISCEEHESMMSEEQQEFKRLKENLGIKDCPQCKIPLEKYEGCNHVACPACDGHICWVCLQTFPTGWRTYDHLHDFHEGQIRDVGAGVVPGVEREIE